MQNHNPFDDKSRLESPSNSGNIDNCDDDTHFGHHNLATNRETGEEDTSPTTHANGRTKQQAATSNNNHDGHQPIKKTLTPLASDEPVTIADIVGEYGPYQLSLTLLVFIRYICVAMMTNTGPLIAPLIEFYCSQVPDSILANIHNKPANQSVQQFLSGKCSIQYNITVNETSIYQCSSWIFNTSEHGVTLTDSFDLVCDHNWLRSAFQSTVSVGVVIACVVWGSTSDRYGRYQTIRICFLVSLFSGIISYFASNFILYTLSRAICSFGDLGLVVSLSTIMVETLGNKYRGAVCIIVYTGWAMGVMIMPWITGYFQNYRLLMLFTVSCHLITLPWLLMVGESVRWSLVNGKIDKAREELRRISWWNHANNPTASIKITEEKFDQYKKKYVFLAERRKLQKSIANVNGVNSSSSRFGGMGKIIQLFQTKELAITTITLVWTTFNSELLYMLFILINSDIGDDIKLNYAIGGIMEILATLISIVMISSLSRRFSLVSTLAIISSLCFVLAFTHNKPDISVWVANSAKLAISTLSSIIYVATTEIFPTNVRQTGIGVSGTLGSCGAVVAPFIREELVNLIGMSSVMLIFVFLPLSAAILIPFFLRETKGVELSDDVEEISSIGVPEQILAEHPPPLSIAIIHGQRQQDPQVKFTDSLNGKWKSTTNNDNLV